MPMSHVTLAVERILSIHGLASVNSLLERLRVTVYEDQGMG